MSDKLAITAHETGLYRIFALGLPASRIAAFTTQQGDNYPLRDALGVTHLDPDHVQIVDLAELKTLGVETYMSEGLGIAEEAYQNALPILSAQGGMVAVIASAAFTRPDIIVPRPPVSFLTLLQEDRPHKPHLEMSSSSAEGQIAPTISNGDGWPTPMPLWAKAFIAATALALIYGLFALFTPGDAL